MIRPRQTQISRLIAQVANEDFHVEQLQSPACFKYTLKDGRTLKVSLGVYLYCTCNKFQTHCIHTLHALIKILKVDVNSPLLYQESYNETDLKAIIASQQNAKDIQVLSNQTEINSLMVLENSCAICYEPLGQEYLINCQSQCKAQFHAKCIHNWGKQREYQNLQFNCPCCRVYWTSQQQDNIIQQLKKQEINNNTNKERCSQCKCDLILGEAYKCGICVNLLYCHRCVKQNKQHFNYHKIYLYRESIIDNWTGNVCELYLWNYLVVKLAFNTDNVEQNRQCDYCNGKFICKKLQCGHLICYACFRNTNEFRNICPHDFVPMFPGFADLIPQEELDVIKARINPKLYAIEQAKQLKLKQQPDKAYLKQVLEDIGFHLKTSKINAQGFQQFRVRKIQLKSVP